MRRPQPILFLVGLFFLLAIGAQVVPFYTDWLWFGEVGYTGRLLDDAVAARLPCSPR